jgi:hypothetical protein
MPEADSGLKTMNIKGTKKSPEDLGPLARLISHPAFDFACAGMILINSLLIGVTTQYLTDHPAEERWMTLAGDLCGLFFLLELITRLCVHRLHWFINADRTWNIFDTVLVALSIVDFTMSHAGGGASAISGNLKTIKMLRIVRIIRVFRFFRELALLAVMIADSVKSLVWALVMLTIIIYVFAICFTQSVTEYAILEYARPVESQSDPVRMANLQRLFGSLERTTYSLIMAMLGGIDWGEVSTPLMDVGPVALFLFMFYILFVLLAVLNIITGVFVDNAVQTAKGQRDFLLMRAQESESMWNATLRQLFSDMDDDESGTLSWEEMQRHLTDHSIKAVWTLLGLNTGDLHRLFWYIDEEACGEVQIDEFLEGCMKLRGEAKSIDLHAVLRSVKRMEERMEGLEWKIDDDIELQQDVVQQLTHGSARPQKKHVTHPRRAGELRDVPLKMVATRD